MSGNWSSSNRRKTLPQNWPELRKQVLERDNYSCRAAMETTGQLCAASASDVDHIDRLGSQTALTNLQALCSWHHKRKSSAEGNASQAPRLSATYPKKKHPGLL